ncbi:MAG: cell division protein SepF [Firmicutes bacterium]|nr:cell division protein SepF [Bacillota bacterium]
MSKFVDKLTSALGISKVYDGDDYDEYDQYDEYNQYDEENESSSRTSSARSSRSSYASDASSTRDTSSARSAGRYGSSSYASSSSRYDRTSSYDRSEPSVTRLSGSSTSSISNYSRLRNSKVVNLNASIQMEVVMVNPETLEEARDIAMQIKDRKPVVINLEFAEPRVAQRITDLLCGCCYALNGNIQRVSDKIFMIAPDTVGFAGDLDIREKLQGENAFNLPWQEQ